MKAPNIQNNVFEKSRTNINETWNLVHSQQGIVEVRALLKKRLEVSSVWEGFGDIVSGYFDNIAAYEKAIVKLDQQAAVKGIYITLNPIMSALSARAHNRLVAAIKGATTADDDIVKRETILIDCDPYRPSEIGSTQQEMDAAIAKRNQVVAWLYSLGFPKLTLGNSGNGAHAVGKVSLPNDDESKQLVNDFLEAINLRFGTVPSDRTEAKRLFQQGVINVGIDTTVFNAGRISKVYGTMVRKGDNTEERPHRRAELTSVPDSREVIPAELLEIVAQEWRNHQAAKQVAKPATQPKSYSANGNRPVNDWYKSSNGVEKWMAEHSIILGSRETYTKDGYQYKWDVDCITSGAHKDGAAIFWGDNKGIGYRCHHDSCKGKTWSDVRDIIDPGHGLGHESHSQREAETRNKPPTKDEQADDAAGIAPETEFNTLKYRAEDGGILDAWLDLYGDNWLFSVGDNRWHYWNKTHWSLDDNLAIDEQIINLMDRMNRDCAKALKEAPERIKSIVDKYTAANVDMPASSANEIKGLEVLSESAKALHRATKRSNSRVSSVEGLARGKRKAPTPKFNIAESINLRNGTLDLQSLELLPHNKKDLFTYCLGYDYEQDATCPTFTRFISEVLVHEGTDETDHNLVALFQELLGYSLTTQTNRQVMVWMPGEGGNGKSVAVLLIKELLGALATSIDFQTLGSPGNYDLADVPGKRVLFSLEAEKGGKVSEKYIKSIVSGDLMKTRQIYGSNIEFYSTAKIWWAMNDKPVIGDTTNAIWRRMKMIPFYRTFDESNADIKMIDKLKLELPGILNWALEGLIRLTLNDQFTSSDNAETAKQAYKEQSNPVSQWIVTHCVKTNYPATLQAALYASFKSWCIDNGEKLITSTQWGLDVKRLKVEKTRKAAGWFYHLGLVDTREHV